MKQAHHENYFFIGSLILVAGLVALIFLPELNVVTLGVTFAVLFEPLYNYLLKLWPKQKALSAFIVVLITVGVIFIPLIFLGFKLFQEAQGLYTNLASGGSIPVLNFFRAELQKEFPSLNINLSSYGQQLLSIVISDVGPLFSEFFAVGGSLLLSFFALFYFLKDRETFTGMMHNNSPLPEEYTKKIIDKLHIMTSSVVRGSLVVSALYGILVGLGFSLFGLPSAVLWGAVTVLASFIPVIGVLLVVVPAIISLVLSGNIGAAIGFAIYAALMSIVVENIVRPRLIGRNADIHPLLMLFSVLGGLSFFGPIGILLGPLSLGLLLTLLEMYPLLRES